MLQCLEVNIFISSFWLFVLLQWHNDSSLVSLLQVLEADNNSIENLEGLHNLPKLEEVLLKNNSILKCNIWNYLVLQYFQYYF